MPAPLNPEKIFTDEPYRSIMNLLTEFKEGLGLKDIQYALMKDHYLSVIGADVHNRLDERVEELVRSDKVKKYKMKIIKRKKKRSRKNKEEHDKAANIRNNVFNFLKKLSNPKINAIYKEHKKYKIREDFRNEGLRLQNKSALDFFSQDKIMDFSIKSRPAKHILYGLSTEIYDKFSSDEKNIIQESLEKMGENIGVIEKIKIKTMLNELEERTNLFLNKTQSERIKKALKEHHSALWDAAQIAILDNSLRDKGIQNQWKIHSSISKLTFYCALGWIFTFPEEEDLTRKIQYHPVINSPYGIKLYNFIKQLPNKSIKLTQNKIKKYLTAWSENFFSEDYKFLIDDINEMIEWSWNNRDLFFDFFPMSIAFSSYKDNMVNVLISPPNISTQRFYY